MRVPLKLALFGATLLLVFGAAWGLGGVMKLPATQATGDLARASTDTALATDTTGMDGMAGMDGESGMDGMDGMSAGPPQGLQVAKDGYAVHVERDVLPLATTADFRFTIVGPDGSPVVAFTPHHDKLMHLVVVRRDFTGFQHLHPTMDPDGTWTQPLALPEAGSYRAYMEFVTDTRELILGIDLTVAGNYRPQPFPAPTTDATVDGYTVTMSGALSAGSDSRITFHISRDGEPVTALQPYLDALGHLVALRSGDMAYLHIHPRAGPGSGPDVVFTATAPGPGAYRLYFQFQTDDTVHTAEFSVAAG